MEWGSAGWDAGVVLLLPNGQLPLPVGRDALTLGRSTPPAFRNLLLPLLVHYRAGPFCQAAEATTVATVLRLPGFKAGMASGRALARCAGSSLLAILEEHLRPGRGKVEDHDECDHYTCEEPNRQASITSTRCRTGSSGSLSSALALAANQAAYH
jgi:hypothetical protein